jgi:uncharacterized protein YwqG
MSFFKKLFGGEPTDPNAGSLDAHMEYLNTLRRPAVHLRGTDTRGFNKLGGVPDLPAGFEWPVWQGKPMSFLCQVDLSTVAGLVNDVACPESGWLYFFYDADQETSGFDPKDKGSWSVKFAPADAPVSRATPPGAATSSAHFKEKCFTPVRIDLYPDSEDARVASMPFDGRQWDTFCDINIPAFGGEPEHHLFGYAQPIQGNDMELECQLVSHGINCGTPEGYESAEAQALEAGAADWGLLLQLDTDDDSDMMWGDGGRLYFWIKRDDLRAGRFDDVWMVLQCF